MTSMFEALRAQLLDAAETLADGPEALAGILSGIVDDVDRALREPLEIFPVCHHSPASAIAMARRLRAKQPKVIYLELCEDMGPMLAELRNCRLPVAVQAFASEVSGFPPDWAPLSVIAPVTEASAEYQAIAYALDTPGAELVLVDRSADHVFGWRSDEPDEPGAPGQPGESGAPEAPDGNAPPSDNESNLHGDSVGVEIGDLRPRFAELEEHLLRHGKVRHWSEWWHQYVEQPLTDADYDAYRQVMVLIGSLFRRLAPGDADRITRDEDRERHMWTRMREHLAASGAEAADCLYVCGAFHAASRVDEFGLTGGGTFEISERTATKWRYGLIPSSHSAIEAQFGLASGSVSIAASVWRKSLTRTRLTPFTLEGQQGKQGQQGKRGKKKPLAVAPVTADEPMTDKLSGFLARPPVLDALDEVELLEWSVEITRLARKAGYLASTADAIAVFETAILLAGVRDRARPTPYDFQDAAVTCIEKDTVPGRRDVRRLCEIMLGGDRIGQVGYEALPPLARDVHDRLGPLNMRLEQRGVQRALLDIAARPELGRCSDILWILRHLMPPGAVRPIMGERRLGETAIQESWDVALGTHQRSLIELGYEGVSIEQVMEQRLRKSVWRPQATAATALGAVEDATLYLRSRRFADELGARAVDLLAAERSVDDAPDVLRRARRLLAHYRATEPALPAWLDAFVTAGYAHYCTLLPTAFIDEDAGARQVAAMLGFLFSMESLAVSLGCDRSQLEIALTQSHPKSPAKEALLWAAKHHLGQMSRAQLRTRCDELLSNPLSLPAFPRYLSGFVHALEPVPGLAGFVVETVSNAFARLPDPVLLPWLPTLITTLRKDGGDMAPLLVREAGQIFPSGLEALDTWTPPWSEDAGEEHLTSDTTAPNTTAPDPAAPGTANPEVSARAAPTSPAMTLLRRHPAAAGALAELLIGGSHRPPHPARQPRG